MNFRRFFHFQLAVWTVFAVFIFPAKLETEGNLLSALAAFGIHDGISITLTFGLGAIYDRFLRKHDDILLFGALVLLSSACASLLQVFLFWLVGDNFPSERRTIFGSSVSLGIFYFRFGLFTCWSLLYFTIRHQREEAERELRMLRAQMNPHLLTNALEHVIRELEPIHVKAAGMIQSLTNYLNYSLLHQKDDFVTMGEDWDALRDFIKLEENLFDSQVDIAGHVDPAIRSVKVPGIILQPLVENAVKYGLQFEHPTVSIRIEVDQRESSLVIAVHNTGHWIKPNPNRTSGGIGLNNLRHRLRRLYGRRHQIETFEEDGWVSVRITIPAKL
ncbi:hypothetical protein BH09VER1_BH09VER1_14120 [soil metagenome]